jgi:hypothetical protein
MTRRLLNLFTGLSLLLCVAAVALWVRSYARVDEITHTREAGYRDVTEWMAVCDSGRIRFSRMRYWWGRGFARHTGESEGWHWESHVPYGPGRRRSGAEPTRLERVGFAWGSYRFPAPSPGTAWVVALPVWVLAVVAGLAPAVRLRARLHRPRDGCCSKCGYDLRATPHRCPECFTETKAG